MTSLAERCRGIWDNICQSKAQMPCKVEIPNNHVDEGEKLQTAFQINEHYFQVRINEMYLTYNRKWFDVYDPMVFAVSEFTYDKKVEAVPFVVGPMMMEKYGQKMPAGMIFSDTRVAGLHPYRGGRLNLSVILCRVKRENYAKRILQMVEGAANALDFSTALGNYVKVSSIVLDGFEALLGLGDMDPLIGFRKEYDPDAGEVLKPNYFALIDLPQSQMNINELWVRNRQLLYGKNLEDAKPFRDADYVLCSIAQTSERSDVATLPFYQLWERVVQEATIAKEDNWESAKANMSAMYQSMSLSPDLTETHAELLSDEYIARMRALRNKAVKISNLGETKMGSSKLDGIRARSLSILKM